MSRREQEHATASSSRRPRHSWRSRYANGSPLSCAAMVIEADVTITRPSSRMAAASSSITGSSRRQRGALARREIGVACAFMARAPAPRPRTLAALRVVAEHVEARAGGRQQHGVARVRVLRGLRRPPPRASRSIRRRAAAQRLRAEQRRIAADQHHAPHLAAKRRGQRPEVLALAIAAGDQHQRAGHARTAPRASRRRSCPSNRRCSARRRRRPPIACDAAVPGTRAAPRASPRAAAPSASPSASAASALAALWRPASFSSSSASSGSRAARQPLAAGLRAAAWYSAPLAASSEKRSRAAPAAPIAATSGSSGLTTAVPQRAEDARLRRRVLLERRVAIEVIGAHVEHRRGARA